MRREHLPRDGARYRLAILFAAVFGTHFGDVYAHDSGLAILPGLAVLAALAAMVSCAERRDRAVGEFHHWLVLILARVAATNIADALAFRAHLPALPLAILLVAAIALLGRRAARALPDAGAAYWTALFAAGLLGTMLGDLSQHEIGQGKAALALLAATILLWAIFGPARRRPGPAAATAGYWLTMVAANTAGTAIADWLAETETLDLGLGAATWLSGIGLAAVLLAGRRRPAPPIAG